MSTDWEDAKCRASDFDLFFSQGKNQIRKAKNICRGLNMDGERACPILEQCFIFATFEEPQYFGIWGASTPDERQRFRSIYKAA